MAVAVYRQLWDSIASTAPSPHRFPGLPRHLLLTEDAATMYKGCRWTEDGNRGGGGGGKGCWPGMHTGTLPRIDM